jgi:hypothetical protein
MPTIAEIARTVEESRVTTCGALNPNIKGCRCTRPQFHDGALHWEIRVGRPPYSYTTCAEWERGEVAS